jgi:hypothetical protein
MMMNFIVKKIVASIIIVLVSRHVRQWARKPDPIRIK